MLIICKRNHVCTNIFFYKNVHILLLFLSRTYALQIQQKSKFSNRYKYINKIKKIHYVLKKIREPATNSCSRFWTNAEQQLQHQQQYIHIFESQKKLRCHIDYAFYDQKNIKIKYLKQANVS
jgi:hypothetical protein